MLSFITAEEEYLMIGEQCRCSVKSLTDLVLKRAPCLVFILSIALRFAGLFTECVLTLRGFSFSLYGYKHDY